MQEATCAKGEMTRDTYAAGDCTLRSKARKCAKCDDDKVVLYQVGHANVYLCDDCLSEVLGGE